MRKKDYTLDEVLPLVETITMFPGIQPGKLGAKHGFNRAETIEMIRILKSNMLVKEISRKYYPLERIATSDPYPYRGTRIPTTSGFYGPASLNPSWVDCVDAKFAPGDGGYFSLEFDSED